MKEVRFFYVPDAKSGILPSDEASHCARVLRLKEGDDLMLADGNGVFYKAQLTAVSNHKCLYSIVEEDVQEKAWEGNIHIAVAPTKNMDRIEWFAEKATEIGIDRLSFLNCRFSERTVIKNERVAKILVSALKQSHKAFMPQLDEMMPFKKFVEEADAEDKFICHCYDEGDLADDCRESLPDGARVVDGKPLLHDLLCRGKKTLVMVGPEGDFSIDEVEFALRHGFRSVSLGKSRLRTETAALTAVHMMWLVNQNCD